MSKLSHGFYSVQRRDHLTKTANILYNKGSRSTMQLVEECHSTGSGSSTDCGILKHCSVVFKKLWVKRLFLLLVLAYLQYNSDSTIVTYHVHILWATDKTYCMLEEQKPLMVGHKNNTPIKHHIALSSRRPILFFHGRQEVNDLAVLKAPLSM